MSYLKRLQRLLPLHWRVIEPDAVLDLGPHVSLPVGYHPGNPSILAHGDDLLVVVRGISYQVDHRLQLTAGGYDAPAVNRLLLIDKSLSVRGPAGFDATRLDGLEDVKLFHVRGRPWAVGSRRVADSKHPLGCAICLAELDGGAESGSRRHALPSPAGFFQEKNWSPFVHQDALHFVYSWNPLVVLRYDTVQRRLETVGRRLPAPGAFRFLEGGSSAGNARNGAYYFLSHRRVVRPPELDRIYLSRLRLLHADLTSTAAGPFFVIGRPTIQFCNGLEMNEDNVFIAFGEMDSRALVARFRRRSFERTVGVGRGAAPA